MKAATFADIALTLATAQLCSTGSLSCRNGTAGHLWPSSLGCTSEHTRGAEWSILNIAFTGKRKSSAPSKAITFSASGTGSRGTSIRLLGKASADHVPPWYIAATQLQTDLAVSSWLDPSYLQNLSGLTWKNQAPDCFTAQCNLPLNGI